MIFSNFPIIRIYYSYNQKKTKNQTNKKKTSQDHCKRCSPCRVPGARTLSLLVALGLLCSPALAQQSLALAFQVLQNPLPPPALSAWLWVSPTVWTWPPFPDSAPTRPFPFCEHAEHPRLWAFVQASTAPGMLSSVPIHAFQISTIL